MRTLPNPTLGEFAAMFTWLAEALIVVPPPPPPPEPFTNVTVIVAAATPAGEEGFRVTVAVYVPAAMPAVLAMLRFKLAGVDGLSAFANSQMPFPPSLA